MPTSHTSANLIDVPHSRPHISIDCYEDELPPFVEQALEHLYGNLFSLLSYYRLFNGNAGVSAYVVRRDGTIVTVWLYRRDAHRVRVLNEGIVVRDEEAMRFAGHIFASFPSVHVISFHAVQARLRGAARPFQRANCLEDIVLSLHASSDAYTAALGKSTRSYINRYLNKLRRDHPLFRFQAFGAQEIDEKDVRNVIGFNHLRMTSKGKESIHHALNTQRIVQLAQERGLFGVITIGDRICAGSINYRVRDNYFLEVLAHDPVYDEYRLGTLCCYLTICECIARGGGEYHFLWGQDAYKSRLLGVQRDLDDLAVYRSRAHMLRHGGMVFSHVANACARRARLWMRDARRRDVFAARVAGNVLEYVRSVRAGWSQ